MTHLEYVPTPKFEEYRERFKDFLIMERKNGIITVRMHTNDGPVEWSYMMHNALPQAWHAIGGDPENEVMILTSTGSQWIAKTNQENMNKVHQEKGEQDYDLRYYDATKLVENLIFDIDFPTIGAVNGPGFHTEIASLCDITICTEDTLFQDGHFLLGVVPGDGQSLVFQNLLGTKRAAYHMYTSKNIDAKTALEWGLVNEIVPREKLLDRAQEIAEMIMKKPRVTRRLTSQLVRRPWKRLLIEDMQVHVGHEMYGDQIVEGQGVFNQIRDSWEK